MPLSQSSAVTRPGRSTATAHAVVDMPRGPVDYSSATDDQGDMNGYGASDERAWGEMKNEEVQDHYNCTDQCDGNPVEILSHLWHTKTGKLWVITDLISGIEKDRFEAEMFELDHAGCLALYIMDSQDRYEKVPECPHIP